MSLACALHATRFGDDGLTACLKLGRDKPGRPRAKKFLSIRPDCARDAQMLSHCRCSSDELMRLAA